MACSSSAGVVAPYPLLLVGAMLAPPELEIMLDLTTAPLGLLLPWTKLLITFCGETLSSLLENWCCYFCCLARTCWNIWYYWLKLYLCYALACCDLGEF
jgi:hypothetical protein